MRHLFPSLGKGWRLGLANTVATAPVERLRRVLVGWWPAARRDVLLWDPSPAHLSELRDVVDGVEALRRVQQLIAQRAEDQRRRRR